MILLNCFKFLWNEYEEDDFSDECEAIQKEIQQCKAQIAAFDTFIESRQELKEVVDGLKDRLFPSLSELEEPNGGHTALLQAKIDYKLHWKMRRLFIKIEPKLKECKTFLGRKRTASILEKLKLLEAPSQELQALFRRGSYTTLSKRLKQMSVRLHPDKAKNVDPNLFTTVLTPLRKQLQKYMK